MRTYPITAFAQPYEVFQCIERDQKVAALMESVEGTQNTARYSVIAWGVKREVHVNRGEDLEEMLTQALRGVEEGELRFTGGLLGYISYDAVRRWETLKDIKPTIEDWPDAEFFLPENVLVYDHTLGKVFVEGDIPIVAGCSDQDNFKVSFYDESMNKPEYESAVNSILEYIRSGYAFQVVLSRFYRYSAQGDPMKLYRALRKVNPSPYMFYIKFNERKLIGSSPELLFSVQKGIAETYPIAGTRPRGKTSEEDFELEQELLSSEKEMAEHLMLVDLARNDVGKVCVPGTVKVPEFAYVEKYSHVQHIVSRVIGTLRKDATSIDVLKSMFPAGTVSGAPKPMAMNIIETLEPYKRGPYAGAVGFISRSSAEFAITIRTAFMNKELLRIQAGAGIVYDSNPGQEYYETEHKMKALKVALGVNE
ncbi:anthranilate synthase component I [Metallosphaera hakonensis]|uniref:anthranilate synthase n=1 Tax=Metallosphaera hakonensis JCM 8857 = DSM 7519 TaxID=1293036 RepID=A0A2U9IVC0_9CREN|nr:anthranilate synthase component I [Metallosphaera hakonensis]AWR99999.1 anthranilate synthase component I [Metallosphaera hakonensis JCM 8857 = DSM 7519]